VRTTAKKENCRKPKERVSFEMKSESKSGLVKARNSLQIRDVTQYILLEIDQDFRGTYYLHHQGDDISETWANFCQTTRRNFPEDSHLQTQLVHNKFI
jgi:tRNA pseudouridine-54 N-methylase